MKKLIWLSIGLAAGALAVWQGPKLVEQAKAGELGSQLSRTAKELSSQAGAFVQDFAQGLRQAEADLRRETGLESISER